MIKTVLYERIWQFNKNLNSTPQSVGITEYFSVVSALFCLCQLRSFMAYISYRIEGDNLKKSKNSISFYL